MTELSIETQQSLQRVALAPPVGPRPLEVFAQALIKHGIKGKKLLVRRDAKR